MDGHQEMCIDSYIDAQRRNIDSIKNLHQFSILGSLVNQFYEISCDSVPKDSPPRFGKCLILCHRSFLAGITLIGQGQPEDAAPITRRAVEIGKLCLGLKFKPQNIEKWLDYEKRMKRWKAREEGASPPHIQLLKSIFPRIIGYLMNLIPFWECFQILTFILLLNLTNHKTGGLLLRENQFPFTSITLPQIRELSRESLFGWRRLMAT